MTSLYGTGAGVPSPSPARGRAGARLAAAAALALLLCAPASARTVVIDGADMDQAAAISETGPRYSWAGYEPWVAVNYGGSFDVLPGRSMLIRFALAKIPAGQRVTNAELILPVTAYGGGDPRFYVWRVLAKWGPGVCHLYRTTRPAKVPWTVPGARGGSSDRATRPTAIARITEPGEQVISVTEDVEIWSTGAASNEGWLITVEDIGTYVRLASPLWDLLQNWKLRITYEPE